VKIGDLVKYSGTVGYGRGVGIVVEMEAAPGSNGPWATTRVRILAPRASKSGYIVQLQHNLEIINECG
jgi:hypothetical protein